MKKLFLIIFLIPAICLGQFTEHPLPAKKPYPYSMAYLEHQPANKKKAPFLIFLHGIGEGTRSGPVGIITRTGLPALIAANKMPVDSFIVLCPQGPKFISILALKSFIAYAKRTYTDGDTSRIYLTGLSGGAITGANYCRDYEVTAAVFCSGYPNSKDICKQKSPTDTTRMYKSVGIPMWLFHGTSDGTVPYKGDVNFVNAYKKCDPHGDILLTLYPGYKHNCWDETYSHLDIYYWLLKHR